MDLKCRGIHSNEWAVVKDLTCTWSRPNGLYIKYKYLYLLLQIQQTVANIICRNSRLAFFLYQQSKCHMILMQRWKGLQMAPIWEDLYCTRADCMSSQEILPEITALWPLHSLALSTSLCVLTSQERIHLPSCCLLLNLNCLTAALLIGITHSRHSNQLAVKYIFKFIKEHNMLAHGKKQVGRTGSLAWPY